MPPPHSVQKLHSLCDDLQMQFVQGAVTGFATTQAGDLNEHYDLSGLGLNRPLNERLISVVAATL